MDVDLLVRVRDEAKEEAKIAVNTLWKVAYNNLAVSADYLCMMIDRDTKLIEDPFL